MADFVRVEGGARFAMPNPYEPAPPIDEPEIQRQNSDIEPIGPPNLLDDVLNPNGCFAAICGLNVIGLLVFGGCWGFDRRELILKSNRQSRCCGWRSFENK